MVISPKVSKISSKISSGHPAMRTSFLSGLNPLKRVIGFSVSAKFSSFSIYKVILQPWGGRLVSTILLPVFCLSSFFVFLCSPLSIYFPDEHNYLMFIQCYLTPHWSSTLVNVLAVWKLPTPLILFLGGYPKRWYWSMNFVLGYWYGLTNMFVWILSSCTHNFNVDFFFFFSFFYTIF